MPVPWQHQVFFFASLFIQYAEACFDSSGDFYCTTLWYFWFVLFWLFMFLFVGVVCIVNRCNKKNRQVDVQFELPPIPPRTARNEEEGGKNEPPPDTPSTTRTETTTA